MKKLIKICNNSYPGAYVDLIDDFVIKNNQYKIYVGACKTNWGPHFHILSSDNEELIVSIEDDNKVLFEKNCNDSILFSNFLKKWLNTPSKYCFTFGTNKQMIETLWNSNNPEDSLPITPNTCDCNQVFNDVFPITRML